MAKRFLGQIVARQGIRPRPRAATAGVAIPAYATLALEQVSLAQLAEDGMVPVDLGHGPVAHIAAIQRQESARAGKRHDAGDKLGFLIATVELALKRDDLGSDFREYLKNLNLN